MKIDLSGRLAVVTGAAGELGRPITRTLAGCGANVVIHYNTSADKARELLDEVLAMGVRAMTVQADITDAQSVARMKEAVHKELGDPDILVNNAVIPSPWTTVLEQDLKAYEDQFRSCVLQSVLMAKAFAPAMIARKWGRIIAINTECSMQCFPTQSAYVAGKRGMDGLLRVLAKEIGPHQITVNQIAPGWMISDKTRATHSESAPDYDKHVALGHRGQDQEIANAVAFLASPLAGFITGVYLPVCGGFVMPAI
jgi:3-oxoacyl-[acyl-carrier protein] reductase